MSDTARLRRLSRAMQWITVVLGGLVLFGVIWIFAAALSDPVTLADMARDVAGEGVPVDLSPSAKLTFGALGLVQVGLLFAVFYRVWRMFGMFAHDEPLSRASATTMRQTGLAFVVLAMGGILIRTGQVLAVTAGNPSGQGKLEVVAGSAEMLTLLAAGVMYVTAHVLVLAADARAEQRAFV